jgi:hypothetical protein
MTDTDYENSQYIISTIPLQLHDPSKDQKLSFTLVFKYKHSFSLLLSDTEREKKKNISHFSKHQVKINTINFNF